ncbi:MAG: hypothetical protein V7643_3942, partial [Mycobacterium sp.]
MDGTGIDSHRPNTAGAPAGIGVVHRLSIRATGSAFGLQLGDRLLDARRPRPWIDQFLGHLITAPA